MLTLSSYKLTFDEEFNEFSWRGAGGTWNTAYAYGERKLNDELQYYADPTGPVDPFSIVDGALVITASASPDPAATWGQPYVSGAITSLGRFAQQYGYFEMRAKLPAGQGLWPAFWLLPVDHVWPPELDVVEAFGNAPNRVHWGALTATSLGNAGAWVDVPGDLTTSYHTYGVSWTAATLTYYFDGAPIARTPTPSDMNQPMYLIANLAVGGHWPGNPSPDTAFPAHLAIDYIRAYSADPASVAAAPQPVSPPDLHRAETQAAPAAMPARCGQETTHRIERDGVTGTPQNDYFQTFYGDTVTRAGGPGDDTYVVTDPRMFILEQPDQGVDSVLAWVDYVLPSNVENITVAAGWGLHVTGNAASNFVTGGAGDDVLNGGPGGDDVLTGGGGRNLFIVAAGTGRDVITDFHPGQDRILLDGFDFSTVNDVVAALQPGETQAVLPFTNGERLVIWNSTGSPLSAADFVLGAVAAPPATPVPQPPPDLHELVLYVSEDACHGDAEFAVTIDGRPLGGPRAVSASHGAGASQAFVFQGEFGRQTHRVGVQFLNDTWDPATGGDRNLYVDALSWDGDRQVAGIALYSNKSVDLTIEPPPFAIQRSQTAMPLFDTAYYLAQNPDVAVAGVDPYQHYVLHGWHEGRNPDAWFDTRYYLLQNADVAQAGCDPLQHFAQHGWREGRAPSLLFDMNAYLSANPDVASADVDPLQHYIEFGRTEGRLAFLPGAGTTPDPLVDPAYYDRQLGATLVPAGAGSAAAAAYSYAHGGWSRGLDPNAWFDTAFYLSRNPDVAAAHINPLRHYEAFGWREGRDPSANFSTARYLAANADVKAAGMDPLLHYVVHGQHEGRSVFPV